jgi:hypothetical protein
MTVDATMGDVEYEARRMIPVAGIQIAETNMKRNLLIALVALMSVACASGAHARSYGAIRVTVSDRVWDTWAGGSYIGRDPDTNVRATLVKLYSWLN